MNTPNIYQKAHNIYKYLFTLNIVYMISLCYGLIKEGMIYDGVSALAVPDEANELACMNFCYKLTDICEASIFSSFFETGITVVLTLLYSVLFYIWWFRTAKAAKEYIPQTTNDMKPGFFIGSFFIPIVCLFHPYNYIKRIYNIFCHPSDSQYKFSLLIITYWISFAINSAINQSLLRKELKEALRPDTDTLSLAELKSEILKYTQLYIINDSIDLVNCVIFAFIMYYIAQSLVVINKQKITPTTPSEI